MKARFYLKGVETNEPNNYPELSINTEYDINGNVTSVSISNWEFGVNDGRKPNDAVISLLKHKDDAFKGGVGLLEGVPFWIDLDNEKGDVYRVFNGFIDLSEAKYYPNKIVAPAIETGKINWLTGQYDKFDYKYLLDIGFFTSEKYIVIPYVINKKVNAFEIIITTLSIYTMTQALVVQIKAIASQAARTANPFESATAILCLILEIIYTIVLLIAIIKLLIDLYTMLIHPVKYHNGMYVNDLLEIGLRYLGLKFSSSILQQPPYDKLAILPEKYNIRENNTGIWNRVVGYILPNKNESNGYYKGTLGDLLRAMQELFHAKIIIENDTLYFEKQDFQLTSAKYTLPNLVDNGYMVNKADLKANFILAFSTDFQDRNTVQEYLGTEYQVTHSPISVNNPLMITLGNKGDGLERYTSPFALGKKKTELTHLEDLLDIFFHSFGGFLDALIKVVNDIIAIINDIIKAINKLIKDLNAIGIKIKIKIPTINPIQSPGFKNLLENRIGLLKMETDFVQVPKLILIENSGNPRNNVLSPGNETYLNAKYIYDEYHYFRNFVTTKGWNNGKIERDLDTIPFTFTDHKNTRTNGLINDYNGNECVLKSLKFKPNQGGGSASGSYYKKEIWTPNLQLTTIEPDGK